MKYKKEKVKQTKIWTQAVKDTEREREWSVKKGESHRHSHRHTEKIKRAYYIKTMK